MSFFELVPDDILIVILLYLDYILRQKLNTITSLLTYDYSRQQLINLCQSSLYVKNISTGVNHSLILSNNGQIYTFGSNIFGQLGLGDYNDRCKPTLIESLTQIIQI